jgi:hypothetical protein
LPTFTALGDETIAIEAQTEASYIASTHGPKFEY